MAGWLAAKGVEIVVCAGYMHAPHAGVPGAVPAAGDQRPPVAAPRVPGTSAVADALAAGAPETGVTVHEVDEGVDTGPILAQERVAILPGDTADVLLERLHAVEHRLLPRVARQLVDERLRSRE